MGLTIDLGDVCQLRNGLPICDPCMCCVLATLLFFIIFKLLFCDLSQRVSVSDFQESVLHIYRKYLL